MTNIIYYYLDDASYSTSSPDSTLSQQQGQEGSGANVKSTTTTVINGVNYLEQVSNNGNEHNLLTNIVLQSSFLKNFSFNELKNATRNFRPGRTGHMPCYLDGSFGQVFKGWVDENTLSSTKPGTGTVVAVKRLNLEGFNGHKKCLMEIKYLGRLYHPNLVRLLGYCLNNEDCLLVYEFMARGCLKINLFTSYSRCQLSWNLRMKIAVDAARAVAFLHSAEINVIHGDVKSSSILLDLNYNAKLCDFEFARDGPIGVTTHVSTTVKGTYGYAAPEYIAAGHLTAKSDVYSFGVVLLEILSGQRVIDSNRPSDQHNLVEWAKPYLNNKHKIFHVLDKLLEGQYSLQNAQKAAKLALQCIDMNAKLRPNMDEVVTTLEQLQCCNG